MDNKLLNINGEGKDLLQLALEFAFKQTGQYPKGWSQDPKNGIILYWCKPPTLDRAEYNSFMGTNNKGVTAAAIIDMLWQWVCLGETYTYITNWAGWDVDCSHDGSNSKGWRVYCEDWGHVAGSSYAICAIRPVWLWHGK